MERERTRIRDEIQRVRGLHESTRKKLENEKFVRNAPAAVVDKEREKAAQFAEQASKLAEKLAVLED